MSHLFGSRQFVGLDDFFEERISNAKTFTNNRPLVVGIGMTVVMLVG